jgi:hypothetical protein
VQVEAEAVRLQIMVESSYWLQQCNIFKLLIYYLRLIIDKYEKLIWLTRFSQFMPLMVSTPALNLEGV